VIDLRSHADGRVSGTVRFGTDGHTYKPYDMHGAFIPRPDGNQGIVGTVSGWPYPSSITVWLGEVDPGGDTLSTKLLSTAGAPPPQAWSSESGTVFRRVAPILGRPRSA
jgi:hypothetical protein